MTEITFHQEFNSEPHAAVNVKVYHVPAFSLMEPYFLRFWDGMHYEDYCEQLFSWVAEDFWEENVQVMARDAGFAGVYSEGRSSGWAVPYYNVNGKDYYIIRQNKVYEDDLEFIPEEIEAYTKFRTSVEKYLDHLNDNIYQMLVEKWHDIELDFLEQHSIAARTLRSIVIVNEGIFV